MRENILTVFAAATSIMLGVVLLSCSAFEPLKVDNLMQDGKRLTELYCSESMAATREKILTKIREKHPDYPAHGYCGFFIHPTELSPDSPTIASDHVTS